MTRKEFDAGMKRLAAHYPDRLPNDVQREDYFEFIEFFRAADLERAIKHLMLIYKWKNFPPLSEIRASLDFVMDQGNPSYATAEELGKPGDTAWCQVCNNSGSVLFEKQYEDTPKWTNTTEKPCTCSAGQRRAEGLRQYFSKLHYKSRLSQVRPEEVQR